MLQQEVWVEISWHLTIWLRFWAQSFNSKPIIDASRCNNFFCVNFHAWFKKIMIIKSEFATQSLLITSYFCDDHLKEVNRLITFSNRRNALLRHTKIWLSMNTEKQYTVAYIDIKNSFQCSLYFNTLWTYVSALILKHGYLPTRFHQSV